MMTHTCRLQRGFYFPNFVRALCFMGFLPVLLHLTANACLADSHREGPTWSEDFVKHLLRFPPGEEKRYKEPLLELAPAVLPEGPYLLGNNHFFGHPVAVMSGDTIIVVYPRQQRHANPKEPNDQYHSAAVTIRSRDGGKTWSEPFDLKTLVRQPTAGCRVGFGISIGVCPDGTVVLVTYYGVFQSEDEGETWKHLSGAFGEDQLSVRTNIGPRVIYHPRYGLIVPGHRNTGLYNPDYTEMLPAEIWLRYSRDKGRTWSEVMQTLPTWCKPAEPTGLVWEDALIFLVRNHGGFDPESRTWRYAQLWSSLGSPPLESKLTNIRYSYAGSVGPESRYWSKVDEKNGLKPQDLSKHGVTNRFHALKAGMDTTDLSYNPVTERLEAVCSNRRGGPPGQEHQHDRQTLNLWSIDPKELLAGSSEWRFEGTLLRRINNHESSKGPVSDGIHPAAAVIDEARGLQHVFVYLGYLNSPSGIFRITRTLDTPSLKAWLDSVP